MTFRLFLVACALVSCTTRGPVAMSQRELKAMGTKSFEGQFEDVFDAAYLSLQQREGRIASVSRLEGTIENAKVELTAPPGWDGTAYRSYALSVYQEGSRVAVTAVPRLWANERDVSDEPLWVLPGNDGEEAHWERLFDGIQDLLDTWRDVPELSIERSRGEVTVLGVRFAAPADWRGLELGPDRRTAVAQSTLRGTAGCAECPGGLNPTIVFEIQRRHPGFDAPKVENAALERALGPKLALPDAWDVKDTATGRRGNGQVVAGDPGRVLAVTWHIWDAGEPAWMILAAAACGPPETPAGCELQWDAMINGVSTTPR